MPENVTTCHKEALQATEVQTITTFYG